ncbi:MAG: hypothetical protein ABH884_02840, partial [Candidatus Komeilibacteria bacterium]
MKKIIKQFNLSTLLRRSLIILLILSMLLLDFSAIFNSLGNIFSISKDGVEESIPIFYRGNNINNNSSADADSQTEDASIETIPIIYKG